MEIINLSDKFFHAIKPDLDWDENYQQKVHNLTIERLSSIFSSGFIMCRENLMKNNMSPKSISRCGFNGNKGISLSRHLSLKDKDHLFPGYLVNDNENAFCDYPFNYIAFVFDESLLQKNKIIINSKRIMLELQVRGDISLDDVVGISTPSSYSLEPFFDITSSHDKALKQHVKNPYYYLKVKYLLQIMEQYGYQLPIVDINTGRICQDNQDYDEQIKKLVR